MKKNIKGLQYRLVKVRYLYMIYTAIVLCILNLFLQIMIWIEDKEFPSDMYLSIVLSVAFFCYFLYANYSKIKKKFYLIMG